MSNLFSNTVQGGGISAPSIQQGSQINPLQNLMGSLQSVGSLFDRPQVSASDLAEQRKTEGYNQANNVINEASQVIDPLERRRFVEARMKEIAPTLTATSQEAFRSVLKDQYGDRSLDEFEIELQLSQEKANFDREVQQIQLGRDMLIANGADPTQVTEDMALWYGMRQAAKDTAMTKRAAELSLMSQERSEADAVRKVGSEIALEAFLYDAESSIGATLAGLQTRLNDPATKMQATEEARTRLQGLKAQLQLGATRAVSGAGGRISDIDYQRLAAVEKQIDYYDQVISGALGSETLENLLQYQGLQLVVSQMPDNPGFAATAMMSFGARNLQNAPFLERAATAGVSGKFNYQDPARMLDLSRSLQTGTPPTRPDEVPAFFNALGSGLNVLAKTSNPPAGIVAEGAKAIVNALYQSTSGLRGVVDVTHRGDALPALHTTVARLNGPSVNVVQQAVMAEMEQQGVDPIELASKDAAHTFRSKILPALRTWDQGLMIERTEFSADGGRIKLKFTAPIASENNAIRMIANSPSLGTNAVRDNYINRDVKMIEQRLNEMIDSYYNLTGIRKQDIADGILSQFNLMMELERNKTK